MSRTAKRAVTYVLIIGLGLVGAFAYEMFVFPNQFAPSGVNGICTIIQHVTGVSVGYLSMLINIPLAIWVYIEVSKPIAVRSMLYVLSFSLGLLILDHVDLSAFAYATDNGTSRILGPLVAGIIQGSCYGTLTKASAYSGGIDFISAVVHHRRPVKSVFGMSFAINVIVACISYFVYDFKIEPVILCILYSFTSSTTAERLSKGARTAVRFEIITDHPQDLANIIITRLNHSATLIPGKGMYHGKPTNILICVVNKTQAAALAGILRSEANTFAVMSQVSEVMGNFKHMTVHGKPEADLLDHGDGKT